MRLKTIMLAALTASALVPAMAPVAASAQSAAEIRQDRREIRGDVRRGDWREAREDRRELREDWRDYRRTHRDVYCQGAYQGPRGYAYRPIAAGHRFAPAYYDRRHWVGDYARYRLPAPGYNRRWVRYGNDIALVNVRNGRVISVYDRFFW